MMSRKTSISELLMLAAIFLSTPVLGDSIDCQSVYGNVDLDGNVMIAAPCTLNGTTVDGNIEIFAGGSLVATGAVIDGNIKAESADFIELRNTEVEGNITLQEMVGDISLFQDSTIDGNVSLKKNRSRLELHRNYIDSNLGAADNSGGLVIFDNVIDGNLSCKNNNPEPEGSNNMVSGDKKDQCRNLQVSGDTDGPGDDNGSGDDDGSGSTGGSGDDDGTGTTGGSETPPFQINSGAGGGASSGPLFIVFLLAAGLLRLRSA